MDHYRYWLDVKESYENLPNVRVNLKTYPSIKETPGGYWLDIGLEKYKWVSKNSRKRFAYPSKEEALNSFIIRTTKWRKIVDRQSRNCEIALTLAIIEEEKLKSTVAKNATTQI